jgi:phosphoglucosamine mutase
VLKFGTDGVRGPADQLVPPFTYALGMAIARATPSGCVLVGYDPRESSERIAREVATGLHAGGRGVMWLGMAPTPTIARVAVSEANPAVIVSASHNPWSDNGIKVVGADGRKLSDDQEATIERELEALLATPNALQGTAIDDWIQGLGGVPEYELDMIGALQGRSLAGLSVVLDCANGASSEIAPVLFENAGADVTVMNAAPNGRNINDNCGSTHPEALQRAVVAQGADLGLAFDGDADRVLAVDENGALVDGDQIMTMAALDLQARGTLTGNAIVVTVMSNLGLHHAMRDAGIDIVTTPVGDRHVVAAMQEHGYVLGGEQSGHIIFSEYATTGDGLLTGLVVCDLVKDHGRPLSELAAQMTRYPQVLVNVRVAGPVDVAQSSALADAIAAVEAEFGDEGRVLVRASGTEPLVRVMVEAATSEDAERATAQLTAVVASEFGAV